MEDKMRFGVIERLSAVAPSAVSERDAAAAQPGVQAAETRRAEDGYVRKTAEQPVRTTPEYPKERRRRIRTIAVVLLFVVLLLVAIARSGLISFR